MSLEDFIGGIFALIMGIICVTTYKSSGTQAFKFSEKNYQITRKLFPWVKSRSSERSCQIGYLIIGVIFILAGVLVISQFIISTALK